MNKQREEDRIENWLHSTDGDVTIPAGFAKDVADVIHWARQVSATVRFRHATDEDVYLIAALDRLDKKYGTK